MPRFAYSGRDRAGQPVTAELEAPSRRDALRVLAARGVQARSVEELAAGKTVARRPAENRNVRALTRRECLPFLEALYDLVHSGLSAGEAVRLLSEDADLTLVLGSRNSSNSQRLAELARERGIPAFLVDGADEIDAGWFDGVETVVITAGASAPESVVQDCVRWLTERFGATVEERTIREEDVYFPLPKELRAAAAAVQLPMA